MPHDWPSDPETISPIGPDVLGSLQRCGFFQRLDDRLCPVDSAQAPIPCGHSFANTIRVLRDLAIDLNELQDVLAWLRANGAHCDCEVLHNIAEEGRLKAKYWKARAKELQRSDPA